jgi:hypothetical protein
LPSIEDELAISILYERASLKHWAQNQLQVSSGSPSAGLYNAFNCDINIPIVADWARMGDARDHKT